MMKHKMSIWDFIVYLPKEIYKFVTYYPCVCFFKYVDYFHYKLLTFFRMSIFTVNPASCFIGNKCYGNLWAVKNAMGTRFQSRCMIEHGVYFGEFVLEDECTEKSIKTIYTYSDYRSNAILKWFNGSLNKEVVAIGPYIQYADHFKSKEKLIKLKNKLGKVLLIFPSHPSPGTSISYDENEFMNEIDSISKDYDTVLVSIYWVDVRRGLYKKYLERGYKIVCSGQRTDRWFLSRQKDLFWLADFSMSNDLGTHIGYSIAMGVPHYIFKQKVEMKEGGVEYSIDKHNQIRMKEYNQMIDVFSSKDPIITNKQIELVENFWGRIKNEKIEFDNNI